MLLLYEDAEVWPIVFEVFTDVCIYCLSANKSSPAFIAFNSAVKYKLVML